MVEEEVEVELVFTLFCLEFQYKWKEDFKEEYNQKWGNGMGR
jgi:hypothetical protein